MFLCAYIPKLVSWIRGAVDELISELTWLEILPWLVLSLQQHNGQLSNSKHDIDLAAAVEHKLE